MARCLWGTVQNTWHYCSPSVALEPAALASPCLCYSYKSMAPWPPSCWIRMLSGRGPGYWTNKLFRWLMHVHIWEPEGLLYRESTYQPAHIPQWTNHEELTPFCFKVAHALVHPSPPVREAHGRKKRFSMQPKQSLSWNIHRVLVSSNCWNRRVLKECDIRDVWSRRGEQEKASLDHDSSFNTWTSWRRPGNHFLKH